MLAAAQQQHMMMMDGAALFGGSNAAASTTSSSSGTHSPQLWSTLQQSTNVLAFPRFVDNDLSTQHYFMPNTLVTRTDSDSGTSSVENNGYPQPWYFEVAGAGGENDVPSSRGPTVTETIIVPSSEHVAEIVGRQGCKIKALRAKTNTYIKTPVRGDDPAFVITGKPSDVLEAKKEIESAADHFTQIRASRRHSQGSQPAPGHMTAYVRVPFRVVGLVVGPKGATIKKIQQDTHTYIVTPGRECDPLFEVTGLPDNVQVAKAQIEEHIMQRTGMLPGTYGGNGGVQLGTTTNDVIGKTQEQHANCYYDGSVPTAFANMYTGYSLTTNNTYDSYASSGFASMKDNQCGNYNMMPVQCKLPQSTPTESAWSTWACDVFDSNRSSAPKRNDEGLGSSPPAMFNSNLAPIGWPTNTGGYYTASDASAKASHHHEEPSSVNDVEHLLMSCILSDLEVV